MTDNEIIKALADKIHFAKYVDISYCLDVEPALIEAAITLINRQKAEIERLREHIELLDIEHEAIKISAVKEFAERLKAKERPTFPLAMVIDVYEIDNLVKEMVGEG